MSQQRQSALALSDNSVIQVLLPFPVETSRTDVSSKQPERSSFLWVGPLITEALKSRGFGKRF